MYIITTSFWPNDKAKEVANVYVKVMTKYPDDANLGTPVVPVAIKPTLEGLKAITVTEVKKGKLDDAVALARNRLGMFLDTPGYRYEIELYANLEESMKLIS